MKKKGSISCVGLGMTLGQHISPAAKSYIEKADVVFAGVSSGIVELWIEELNPNTISLQPLYEEGTSRLVTYKKMVEVMMCELRKGKSVCGAFYGHPGIFSWAPHKVIEQARKEGFLALMEPGISAEDCLYSDLAIDPGTYGCQHFEASQFLFFERNIDISAYLILWQIGVAGDRSLGKFKVNSSYKQVLMDELITLYSEQHEITLYEASILPNQSPRVERIKISNYLESNISLHTTMVVPPMKEKLENKLILDKLRSLE